jgi:hypothetical protein
MFGRLHLYPYDLAVLVLDQYIGSKHIEARGYRHAPCSGTEAIEPPLAEVA